MHIIKFNDRLLHDIGLSSMDGIVQHEQQVRHGLRRDKTYEIETKKKTKNLGRPVYGGNERELHFFIAV
jgi:hypothetical protein